MITASSNYAKTAALLAHSVSEFTHSFSFTPSSGLYYWSNIGNRVDFEQRAW